MKKWIFRYIHQKLHRSFLTKRKLPVHDIAIAMLIHSEMKVNTIHVLLVHFTAVTHEYTSYTSPGNNTVLEGDQKPIQCFPISLPDRCQRRYTIENLEHGQWWFKWSCGRISKTSHHVGYHTERRRATPKFESYRPRLSGTKPSADGMKNRQRIKPVRRIKKILTNNWM